MYIALTLLTIFHKFTNNWFYDFNHFAEWLIARYRTGRQAHNFGARHKVIGAWSFCRRLVGVTTVVSRVGMIVHQNWFWRWNVKVLMHFIKVTIAKHRRCEEFIQFNNFLWKALYNKLFGFFD